MAGRLGGDAGIKESSRGDVVFQGFFIKKRSEKCCLETILVESESAPELSPGGFIDAKVKVTLTNVPSDIGKGGANLVKCRRKTM